MTHHSKNPYCLAFTALLLCIIGDGKRSCCLCPLKYETSSHLWKNRCIWSGQFQTKPPVLSRTLGAGSAHYYRFQVLCPQESFGYNAKDPVMALVAVPQLESTALPSALHHWPVLRLFSGTRETSRIQQVSNRDYNLDLKEIH